jgi:hypothetical protein
LGILRARSTGCLGNFACDGDVFVCFAVEAAGFLRARGFVEADCALRLLVAARRAFGFVSDGESPLGGTLWLGIT